MRPLRAYRLKAWSMAIRLPKSRKMSGVKTQPVPCARMRLSTVASIDCVCFFPVILEESLLYFSSKINLGFYGLLFVVQALQRPYKRHPHAIQGSVLQHRVIAACWSQSPFSLSLRLVQQSFSVGTTTEKSYSFTDVQEQPATRGNPPSPGWPRRL